jgi:uncharacterized protein (TIGR03435 family)
MAIALRNSLQRSILFVIVSGFVVCAFVDVPKISAQSTQTAVAPLPSFEVASVKPSNPGDDQTLCHIRYGRLRVTAGTIKFLFELAYGVKDFQVSGGPSWINSEKYDVNAKVEDALVEPLEKLPVGEQWVQYQQRVQSLLADRFKLRVSRETKDLPVYALVIAKNGPKLRQAEPGDTYPSGLKDMVGRGHGNQVRVVPLDGGQVEIIGQGIPINSVTSTAGIPGSLVQWLTEGLGRPVQDQTGLKGNYDFTLRWTPDESEGMFRGLHDEKLGADNQPSPESLGLSIFTAIREQLGLKLVPSKGPVEVLVIDHIERPSEN